MVDTGSPIKDAIHSVANVCSTMAATWGIKHVYSYPAHTGPGCPANSLTVGLGAGVLATFTHVGGLLEYRIPIVITYVSPYRKSYAHYHDAAALVATMITYFVEHPQPDSFGEILGISNGQIELTTFPDEPEGQVFVCAITVVLGYETTVTIS